MRLSIPVLAIAIVPLFQTVMAEAPKDGTNESVLSRGGGVELTRADYTGFAAGGGLSQELRRRLLTDDDALREFVLDFHSDRALVQQAERMGLDATPEFRRTLAEARDRLLVRALMEQVVDKDTKTPDFLAPARERYTVDPDAFRIPERRKAAHILIRNTVPRGEACTCEPPISIADLQARLEQGASFAEFAKQFSEDEASASQGGLIDHWVTKDSDEFAPPFHKALFALQHQGDVSAPVQTRYGTHLVQWADTQPGRVPEFQEVRAALIEQLRAEYLKSKQSELLSAAYPDLDSLRLDEIRALFEQTERSQ